MKKYKFIGTEQDLIDVGFDFCESQDWTGGHFERANTFGYCMVDYYDDKHIYFIEEESDINKIQDLIDKGLVVEVENEK